VPRGEFALDSGLPLVVDTGGIGVPVIPPLEEHAAMTIPVAATSSGVNRIFFSFGSFDLGEVLSRSRFAGSRESEIRSLEPLMHKLIAG
jgi:hypothetical protein